VRPEEIKYLEFITKYVYGRKTPIVEVYNQFSKILLGKIVYCPEWRTYVFEPEKRTKFHVGCQKQITEFNETLNKMRKEKVGGY